VGKGGGDHLPGAKAILKSFLNIKSFYFNANPQKREKGTKGTKRPKGQREKGTKGMNLPGEKSVFI